MVVRTAQMSQLTESDLQTSDAVSTLTVYATQHSARCCLTRFAIATKIINAHVAGSTSEHHVLKSFNFFSNCRDELLKKYGDKIKMGCLQE